MFALLHLSQKAAGQVVLTAQYVGDQPSLLNDFAGDIGEGLPAPVGSTTAIGHHNTVAATTDIRTLPWLFATQTLNGTGPNQRGKYKSAYLRTEFPDPQIAAMWKNLSSAEHPNPQALVQVDSYGCQINAVDPAATAVPQRDSIMKLQFQTYWTDEADDEANLAWIREFYIDMYGAAGPVPDDTMDGCYVNYPDVDLDDWQTLYYKENYARLQAVKARWDPLDIFNHQQSIELP
jgi:FAD/FMN-containing dehydrogenase